jgi:hypothetical protein
LRPFQLNYVSSDREAGIDLFDYEIAALMAA